MPVLVQYVRISWCHCHYTCLCLAEGNPHWRFWIFLSKVGENEISRNTKTAFWITAHPLHSHTLHAKAGTWQTIQVIFVPHDCINTYTNALGRSRLARNDCLSPNINPCFFLWMWYRWSFQIDFPQQSQQVKQPNQANPTKPMTLVAPQNTQTPNLWSRWWISCFSPQFQHWRWKNLTGLMQSQGTSTTKWNETMLLLLQPILHRLSHCFQI